MLRAKLEKVKARGKADIASNLRKLPRGQDRRRRCGIREGFGATSPRLAGNRSPATGEHGNGDTSDEPDTPDEAESLSRLGKLEGHSKKSTYLNRLRFILTLSSGQFWLNSVLGRSQTVRMNRRRLRYVDFLAIF